MTTATAVNDLTYSQLLAEARDILNRSTGDELAGDDAARFGTIQTRIVELHAESDRLEQRRASVRDAAKGTAVTFERGDDAGAEHFNVTRQRDPWQDQQGEIRGRAVAAIEHTRSAPDAGRELIVRAVESGDLESDLIARWAVATSDPAYSRAFWKIASDPETGHTEFTGEELGAYRQARQLQRAMSLTDGSGGYLVPFHLDPAILNTGTGGTNPIRQLARRVTVATDVWNGVSSAGVTASFDAEAAEVSDDAPTLAQPSITVRAMRAFVPVSRESFEDMTNAAAEIGELMRDAAEVLEAEKFITGVAASNEPVGLVTGLVAAGGTSVIATATTGTLDAADAFSLKQALPPRFQPRASWLMHGVFLDRFRTLIAGTGLTTPMLDDSSDPPKLLGKTAYEASFMDSTIAAGTTADYVAIYGHIAQAYTIVDRVGTTIELVPHLFGANGRPTGQRGWFMWRRVGGGLVNASAARVLNKSA